MADERQLMEPLDGFASREAALFVAQMDDQSRNLTKDTRGASVEELAWQPARGMNTIGMLLAHHAIVEAYWIQVATTGNSEFDSTPLLGIGTDDDAMPLPDDGLPPDTLAGKPLAFFDDLLARARANTKQVVSRFSDADLDKVWTLHRKNGDKREFSVRWILYHILEHEAGHYGQINLLRHQHRIATAATARAR